MSEVSFGMRLLEHPCAEHCCPYRLRSVHVILGYHTLTYTNIMHTIMYYHTITSGSIATRHPNRWFTLVGRVGRRLTNGFDPLARKEIQILASSTSKPARRYIRQADFRPDQTISTQTQPLHRKTHTTQAFSSHHGCHQISSPRLDGRD
jgi:hypothetical protein